MTTLRVKSLISVSIFVVIMHQAKQILKTVTDNCPFNEKNPGRFAVIAITLMLGAFAVNAAEAVVVSIINDMLKIPGMSVHFAVNGTMFLSGLLILILAGIFQYGSYLQEEYDTTL